MTLQHHWLLELQFSTSLTETFPKIDVGCNEPLKQTARSLRISSGVSAAYKSMSGGRKLKWLRNGQAVSRQQWLLCWLCHETKTETEE